MSQRWRKQKGLFQSPHSTYRIPGWFWARRDLKDPPEQGRDTFHTTRILQTPSSLALNPSGVFLVHSLCIIHMKLEQKEVSVALGRIKQPLRHQEHTFYPQCCVDRTLKHGTIQSHPPVSAGAGKSAGKRRHGKAQKCLLSTAVINACPDSQPSAPKGHNAGERPQRRHNAGERPQSRESSRWIPQRAGGEASGASV